MYPILINTFREIYRNKIIYFAIVFVVVLMIFSIFLGQLSVGNTSIVVRDFGLALLEVFAILYGLFITSEVISKEIENKTIYLILTKPVKKGNLLVGKLLGASLAFLFIFIIQCIIYLGVLVFSNYEISLLIIISLIAIFLTGILFLLNVIFFSLFLGRNLSILLSLCLFIAGRIWFNVEFLFSLSSSSFSHLFATVIGYIIPPYGLINIKEALAITSQVDTKNLYFILLYYGVYISILFILTLILFNRKKFD